MNLAVTHPYLLLLLPLASLPLLFPVQRAEAYPSLGGADRDTLSAAIDLALRLLGVAAIAFLILGLSGLYRLGQSIERLGEGANIVLLFDRSASMNDTFAGQTPTGGEESKSAAAEGFLKDFVTKREHDRFGVAAFSTSPMFVLPLSDHKEATLGAIDAIELPGLALTNVGKGLAMALSMQDADILSSEGADGAVASRAIVLVSDGAAVIDRKVQQKLTEAFIKRPISLYWIFLRTEGSHGPFDLPQKGDDDTPYAMPERHLNLFFESLKIPYKAFEAENPAAVGEAVAAIDKLERRPMRYFERIPQKDLSGVAYAVSAIALLLLVLAKLAETRLSQPPARRLLLLLLIPLVLESGPRAVQAAELTRDEVIAAIAKADGVPDLTRKDLTGLDLSGVDFKGADLFATDLSGAKLAGANLASSNLNRAVFRDADLANAKLTGANMFAVMMNGANLSGADLSGARIIGELKEAHLDGAKIIGSDLGADPTNQGMVPVRVDMSGAILDGADLSQSNLGGAVLSFAKLRNARLVETRFYWAKLDGADLSGSDVTRADFSNADMTGTILTGIKGADSAGGLAKAP